MLCHWGQGTKKDKTFHSSVSLSPKQYEQK